MGLYLSPPLSQEVTLMDTNLDTMQPQQKSMSQLSRCF